MEAMMTDKHREYVRDRIAIDAQTQCWLWQRGLNWKGYGEVGLKNVPDGRMAHRFSYRAFVGEIPDGLQLDHLCRNRACVNPAHLEPVTAAENNRRSSRWPNATEGQCYRGHPQTDDNVWVNKRGGRECRPCKRARRVEAYRRAGRVLNPRAQRTHAEVAARVAASVAQNPGALCMRGHLLDQANLYVRANGVRECRICMKLVDDAFKARRAQAVQS